MEKISETLGRDMSRLTDTQISLSKFTCRNCRDEGFEDHTLFYQHYGTSDKHFCIECEKGKKIFEKWRNAPEQIRHFQKEKQEKIAKAIQISHFSPNHRNAKLSDLRDNETLYRTCKMYIENWLKIKKEGLGYYFWGNVGAGKTYTTAVLANELMREHFVEVLFLKMPEAVAQIKKTFGSEKNDPAKKLFEKMCKVELLILDDLGIEKVSEWLADEIYQVMEYRTSHYMPMIITSNQSLGDLGKIYREQVSSRINGCSKSIHFTQKDRRHKTKEKSKETLF
jgi:DNA replication protein DnaC